MLQIVGIVILNDRRNNNKIIYFLEGSASSATNDRVNDKRARDGFWPCGQSGILASRRSQDRAPAVAVSRRFVLACC
jgi:hypothetical protein